MMTFLAHNGKPGKEITCLGARREAALDSCEGTARSATSLQEWALKDCHAKRYSGPCHTLRALVLKSHDKAEVSGLQKVLQTPWWLSSEELDVLCKQFLLQPLSLQEVDAVTRCDTQHWP